MSAFQRVTPILTRRLVTQPVGVASRTTPNTVTPQKSPTMGQALDPRLARSEYGRESPDNVHSGRP